MIVHTQAFPTTSMLKSPHTTVFPARTHLVTGTLTTFAEIMDNTCLGCYVTLPMLPDILLKSAWGVVNWARPTSNLCRLVTSLGMLCLGCSHLEKHTAN